MVGTWRERLVLHRQAFLFFSLASMQDILYSCFYPIPTVVLNGYCGHRVKTPSVSALGVFVCQLPQVAAAPPRTPPARSLQRRCLQVSNGDRFGAGALLVN